MCRVMDYKNSKKNSIKPPYEEVIDTWHPHVQHYGAASLFAIPRSDRTKWMNHPFLSGFRVFSCGLSFLGLGTLGFFVVLSLDG